MNSALRIALIPVLAVPGCSERQMYEGLQKRNEARCNELPTAQQAKCLEEMKGPDYDSYQRELKKP